MIDNKLWKKIDVTDDIRPSLCKDDECYYAREFIVGGGYEASPANQLILNYKIEVKHKNTNRWQYKEKAINKFATELSSVIGGECMISYIPTSKGKEDPNYDPRLEETCKIAVQMNRYLRFEEPIILKNNVLASHSGGSRNVGEIYASYQWQGFKENPLNYIIVIDDVITQGSHYKAYKKLLHEHYPNIKIAGFFWTKAIYRY